MYSTGFANYGKYFNLVFGYGAGPVEDLNNIFFYLNNSGKN